MERGLENSRSSIISSYFENSRETLQKSLINAFKSQNGTVKLPTHDICIETQSEGPGKSGQIGHLLALFLIWICLEFAANGHTHETLWKVCQSWELLGEKVSINFSRSFLGALPLLVSWEAEPEGMSASLCVYQHFIKDSWTSFNVKLF